MSSETSERPRIERAPPVALLAFTSVAAVHVLRAGPSVAVRDAGELTAAAALLDVAHPTGFVADMTLTRVFLSLAPIGDAAFRANVLVGLWGALAAAVGAKTVYALARAVRSRALRALAAAAVPVVLAASPTVVRAATAMEVYTLALAVSLAALAQLVPLGRWPVAARARGLAFAAGASVLVHTGVRPAIGLAFVVCAWRALRERTLRSIARASARYLAFVLAGALPVAYLALAARRGGPIDWSDPRTASGVWSHVTAARIRGAFASRTFVSWRMGEDLATALGQLRADLGVVVPALAAIGLAWSLRSRVARWVVLAALADFAYAVQVNPMGLVDRQNLFLTQACVAILAGFSLAKIASVLPPRRGVGAAGALLGALALVDAATRSDARFVARADGFSPSEILGGAGALGTVPPRAIVLCESDDLCGGAMYAQYVEGERPDVSVLPRQHLWDASAWRRLRVGAALRVREPAVEGRPAAEANARRMRWLVATFRGQIRWQPGNTDDEQLARVRLGTGETPVLATVDGVLDARDADPWAWLAPRTTEGHWSRRLAATAIAAAARRIHPVDRSRAIVLLQQAERLDPTYPTALVNLGVLAMGDGRTSEARRWLERAVREDPDRVAAWERLAVLYDAAGERENAARARRESVRRRGP